MNSSQSNRLEKLERETGSANRPPMFCAVDFWEELDRYKWKGKLYDSRESLDAAMAETGFGSTKGDQLVLVKYYGGNAEPLNESNSALE